MRLVSAVFAAGVLVALAFPAVGAPGAAARCTPTPNDGGGPDRGSARLRAKIGTGHVLTGVVLSPGCTPVAGAEISFWQANAKGVYTQAGRGAVVTNRVGRFRFEGPMPKPYEGRPAHIHIRVEAPDYEPLYTRYEPRGRHRGTVRLVLLPSAV